MDQGLIALLFQPGEKALGIGKLGLVAGAGRPTQGKPSRFEALAQRLASTAGHERTKPLDQAAKARSAFGRQAAISLWSIGDRKKPGPKRLGRRQVLAQRGEIRLAQAAPGRAQHPEPGRPIAGMGKGEGQGGEVGDQRPLLEPVEVGGMNRQPPLAEDFEEGQRVLAASHQDRDLAAWHLVFDPIGDVGYERIPRPLGKRSLLRAMEPAVFDGRSPLAGGRGHAPCRPLLLRLVALGQQLAKAAIDLLDQLAAAAEVSAEREALKRQRA